MDPVLTRQKEPGTSKIIEIILEILSFEEIVLLSLSRFWTSFWHPFGHLFGSLLAPRWLKPVLRFLLERPRAALEIFFSVPEAAKSAPTAFQEASKSTPGCQDSSKSSPRGPRIDFRAILEPCWKPFLMKSELSNNLQDLSYRPLSGAGGRWALAP